MTMIKGELKDLADMNSESLASSQSSRDSQSSFELEHFGNQVIRQQQQQRRRLRREPRCRRRESSPGADQPPSNHRNEIDEDQDDEDDDEDEAERQERFERQSNLSFEASANSNGADQLQHPQQHHHHRQQFKLNHSDEDEQSDQGAGQQRPPAAEQPRPHLQQQQQQHGFAQLKQQLTEQQAQHQFQQQQQQLQYSQLISGLAATNTTANANSFLEQQQQQQFYAIRGQQQQQQGPPPPPPTGQQPQQHQQQAQQPQLGLDGRPKRNPYCSRCRNHGKSAQVKGHKRHCEYRDCQCEGCKLVECRQIVSAAQIKRRRYQKQDEECGRRIEVSPPVLTREPNSDPAALIAKTLIGSASSKHHASAAQKQLVAAAISSGGGGGAAAAFASPATSLPALGGGHSGPGEHPALLGLSAINSVTAAGAAAVSPTATAPCSSAGSLSTLAASGGGPPANGPAAKAGANARRQHLQPLLPAGQHQPHQPHQLQHQQQPHQLPGVLRLAGKQRLPLPGAGPNQPGGFGSALDEALHFFQFPNSVLSALANPQAAGAAAAAAAAAAASLLNSAAPLSSSGPSCNSAGACPAPANLPSIREQFSLVEEIHQAFGPLAVYAWLRAEHFNLAKVRQAIELAKLSFDELLQINGHSPLDLTSPIVD